MVEELILTLVILFLYGIVAILAVVILIAIGAKWRSLRISSGFIQFAMVSGALAIMASVIIGSVVGLFIYINALI